jgi:predicted MFS family arabinose efflux permease
VAKQASPSLAAQLGALTLARLFLNIGLRMVYPFAPALARGLGVELTAVYRLIALRNLTGFLSPLFGPLSERFGRKIIMLVAMLIFALGALLVFVWPAYWPLGAALALLSLAKILYDPAMQAHIGDTVPYRRRGQAIAVTELAWALALLGGAPIVGLLIQRQGWQAPFFWLGALSLAATALLWRVVVDSGKRAGQAASLGAVLRVLRRHPVIWFAVAYLTAAMTANEMLFIVYGDWMEGSFGLALATLGLASGVIGGAEIVGELFAGWSVDRFGKRRVIIVTGLLNALLYFTIPYTSGSLGAALVTLFLLFLFFEITIVGGIPLMTELVPSARGVVMSMVLTAMSLGRTLGSLLGPIIWAQGGFRSTGLAAALVMATAVFILARWVREGE